MLRVHSTNEKATYNLPTESQGQTRLRPRMRDKIISIHLFKAYARSATNDGDIARNIHEKALQYKIFGVAGNIVHFKYR